MNDGEPSPLPLTVLIDTERSFRSVAHLIRTPRNPQARVIRVSAHSSAKLVEKAGEDLQKMRLKQWEDGPLLEREEYDQIALVAIDTISHIANVARRELTGQLRLGEIWAHHEKLISSPRDYGIMSDYLARTVEAVVAYCENNNKRLLLLAHQRKVEEEKDMPKVTTLDFNPKLNNEVVENSDYVWRMWREEKSIKSDGVTYPRGTHFLKLTTSENKATKIRLPYMYQMPDLMPNPTLGKIFAMLSQFGDDYLPLIFTIYGPGGSGKTTLAVSLSDPNALDQGIKNTLTIAQPTAPTTQPTASTTATPTTNQRARISPKLRVRS